MDRIASTTIEEQIEALLVDGLREPHHPRCPAPYAPPLEALVIGAYVRGLSDRDIESPMDEAGLGHVSRTKASEICKQLPHGAPSARI